MLVVYVKDNSAVLFYIMLNKKLRDAWTVNVRRNFTLKAKDAGLR